MNYADLMTNNYYKNSLPYSSSFQFIKILNELFTSISLVSEKIIICSGTTKYSRDAYGAPIDTARRLAKN